MFWRRIVPINPIGVKAYFMVFSSQIGRQRKSGKNLHRGSESLSQLVSQFIVTNVKTSREPAQVDVQTQ